MKKTLSIVTLIVLFSINSLSAQLESILQVEEPTGLVIINDTLYIGSYDDAFFKYDIDSGQYPELLFTGSSFRFVEYAGKFFIPDLNENIYQYNIKNHTLDIYYNQGQDIGGVAIFNDTLYYAEWGIGEIRKINLKDGSGSSSELLFSGLDSLNAMYQHGNHLYFIEHWNGALFRTNLTDANPMIDTLFYEKFDFPTELHIIGEYMYVSEFGGNQISRFKFAEENPAIEVVLENILSPTGLNRNDEYLYISSFYGNEIFRLPLDLISSTEKYPTVSSLQFYPNPSSGRVVVEGIMDESFYEVYTTTGQLFQSGLISNGEEIDLVNAREKIYFIKIGDSPLSRLVINN